MPSGGVQADDGKIRETYEANSIYNMHGEPGADFYGAGQGSRQQQLPAEGESDGQSVVCSSHDSKTKSSDDRQFRTGDNAAQREHGAFSQLRRNIAKRFKCAGASQWDTE